MCNVLKSLMKGLKRLREQGEILLYKSMVCLECRNEKELMMFKKGSDNKPPSWYWKDFW